MTGSEIKKLRALLGLNQKKMAETLGVQQSRVSEWERGDRLVPAYIVKLVECLKSCHHSTVQPG